VLQGDCQLWDAAEEAVRDGGLRGGVRVCSADLQEVRRVADVYEKQLQVGMSAAMAASSKAGRKLGDSSTEAQWWRNRPDLESIIDVMQAYTFGSKRDIMASRLVSVYAAFDAVVA
jgi:hypothetical protein